MNCVLILRMVGYILRRTFRSFIIHECVAYVYVHRWVGYGDINLLSEVVFPLSFAMANLVRSQYDAGQLLTGLAPYESHTRVA